MATMDVVVEQPAENHIVEEEEEESVSQQSDIEVNINFSVAYILYFRSLLLPPIRC